MRKIKLDTDAEFLGCPICGKTKRVSDGVYEVKIAINGEPKECQHDIGLFSHYGVICNDCKKEFEEGLKGKSKKKKGPKDNA